MAITCRKKIRVSAVSYWPLTIIFAAFEENAYFVAIKTNGHDAYQIIYIISSPYGFQ